MQTLALRSAVPKFPVAGLIALEDQVPALCAKLTGHGDLMLVMGDKWLAVFSFKDEVTLPWLPDRPLYLYAFAPGLLCQSGFEPDLPKPLFPVLAKRLASKGTAAITDGPKLWDFSAAMPIERCNLQALL